MFLQHCKCNLSVGVGTEKVLMQQHKKTPIRIRIRNNFKDLAEENQLSQCEQSEKLVKSLRTCMFAENHLNHSHKQENHIIPNYSQKNNCNVKSIFF